MTLKQLAIEIQRLVLEGKGDKLAYFSDGTVTLPVSRILEQKLADVDVIVLKY